MKETTFSSEELHQVLAWAKERIRLAEKRGWKDKNQRPSLRSHYLGVGGEWAACRIARIPYVFTNGTRKDQPDCHNFDVRASSDPKKGMIVRLDDPPERPCAHVAWTSRYTVQYNGWAFCGDIQELGQTHSWFTPGKKGWKPCWFVPKSALNQSLDQMLLAGGTK